MSWRRHDSQALDPETGMTQAAAQPLLATDDGDVTVLHLDPGGSTPRAAPPHGRLLIVVEGAGTVEIGTDTTAVRAGEAVRAPADAPLQLRTDEGISVVVIEHPEDVRSWRVSRVDDRGRRWVCGVFADTEQARQHRDRLRAELPDGESAAMD